MVAVLNVALVGVGLVGSALLRQISDQIDALSKLGLQLRVVAIVRTRLMWTLQDGIAVPEASDWADAMENEGVPTDFHQLASFLAGLDGDAVLCDCTASDQVTDLYHYFLSRGLHIATANKRANSGDLKNYDALREVQRTSRSMFFYEANVAAGLPLLSTLRDMIQTGDTIESIEGVLSGTLSYLFNEFTGGSFAALVRAAKRAGYTEPDPREDLSGADVARKVVILAREVGLRVGGVGDVAVESLVPRELRGGAGVEVEGFLERLGEYDGELAKAAGEAEREGCRLRYVGVVGGGGCKVEVRRYPESHPFANLKASDNMVLIRSRRYNKQPLVVQGPGAGADVTAAGVFGDILKIARGLGARL